MTAHREIPFLQGPQIRAGGWTAIKSALETTTGQYAALPSDHNAHPAPNLRIVLDSLPCAVTVIDRDYRVWLANRASAEFLILPPVQSEGQSCFAAFRYPSGLCQAGADCPVNNVLQSNLPYRTVLSYLDRQARRRFVEISASPLFDDAGRVAQVVLMHRDVTESALAKLQLKTPRKVEPASGTISSTHSWSIQTDEIRHSSRLSIHASGVPKVPEVGNLVMERVGQIADTQCRAVLHLSAESRVLSVRYGQGDCAGISRLLESFRSADDIPILSEALEGTLFIRDLSKVPALMPLAPRYSPPTSVAAITLRSKGVVLGMLVVVGPPGQVLDSRQVEMLELSVDQAAVEVERAMPV